MKNLYLITVIFLLSSCQTLSSIQETLGFVEEDPNAPVKLDENYESFLDISWQKKDRETIIRFKFLWRKY
jgi:hypothetical protein